MRKAKRVRFDDSETDGAAVYANLRRREVAQSPRSGSPKTSEYAYFRKVKNGAVHGRSQSLNKENVRLKSSKYDYLASETISVSDMLKSRKKGIEYSEPGQREGPSERNIFLSPRVCEYDRPDKIRSKEVTNKTEKRSSLLSVNVTPVGRSPLSSSFNEAPETSENQNSEKRIFSAKRFRLRQWASHTSLSEVENLHNKRIDLVSLLLNRLFPNGNENNDSSKGDADNSCKILALHESNYMEKGLHLSHNDKDLQKNCSSRSTETVLPERNPFVSGFHFPNSGIESYVQDELMNLDQHSNSHMRRRFQPQHDLSILPYEGYRSFDSFHDADRNLQKFSSGRLSDIVLLERSTFLPGFHFPSSGLENHVQDELMNLDQYSNSRMHRRSQPNHDLSFLPYESYRSSESFHFRELDELGSVIEHSRKEPERDGLDLDWGTEYGTDRVDSSIINHHTATNVFARLETTYNADQQRVVDDVLNARGLCSSSLLPNYYPDLNRVPNYGLTRDFEPDLDNVKCAMSEPGRFSLAAPCSPKCITLPEDRNSAYKLYNSNIIFSYKDQHWLKNNIWDAKSESDFQWNCLSAGEHHPWIFNASWFPQNKKSLYSLSRLKEGPGEDDTIFAEGTCHHDFLLSNLKPSFDAPINPPLLLDHASQDRFDQELYFDDDYNEFEYR